MDRPSRLATVVLLFVLATGCAHARAHAPESNASVVLQVFQSDACNETPVYEIAVRSDGLVEYQGLAYVANRERGSKRVSPERVVDLLRNLDFSKREKLSDADLVMHLRRSCATGPSTVTIAVDRGGMREGICANDPSLSLQIVEGLELQSWVALDLTNGWTKNQRLLPFWPKAP